MIGQCYLEYKWATKGTRTLTTYQPTYLVLLVIDSVLICICLFRDYGSGNEAFRAAQHQNHHDSFLDYTVLSSFNCGCGPCALNLMGRSVNSIWFSKLLQKGNVFHSNFQTGLAGWHNEGNMEKFQLIFSQTLKTITPLANFLIKNWPGRDFFFNVVW